MRHRHHAGDAGRGLGLAVHPGAGFLLWLWLELEAAIGQLLLERVTTFRFLDGELLLLVQVVAVRFLVHAARRGELARRGERDNALPSAPKLLITPIFTDFSRFFPVFPWTSGRVLWIPGVQTEKMGEKWGKMGKKWVKNG